ncbi:MAG: DAK2 domain-containing protein [Ruminococcaceae bacterium]|nr:DAK2 domain-containing protein [Oscillospiraceae bacterium]
MLIDGHTFAGMLISAANALDNNQKAINNMNVFPVPDGDTGINMTLTMSTVRALKDFDGTISDCADRMAKMILRAARGNSGAILSLFFRGMSKALRGLEKADSPDIARAFKAGTEEAYKAVMKPTEGTILTVMRLCSEKALDVAEKKYRGDVVGLFGYILKMAEDALAKTPDMLPILKEVHVVDAGGYGFCVVVSGMLDALKNKPVAQLNVISEEVKSESAFDNFSTEDIKFTYCTECIVDKDEAHMGEGSAKELNDYISTLGDSVVFAEDDTMIKLHVHTNNPGLVMEKALTFGSLATVKIENMKIQHSEKVVSGTKTEKVVKIQKPTKKYGFVAVCMGGGISDTFRDFGVDQIIYGGQTMNPSTQDIIDGIDMTPAECVYVLPNNKNIYLVAIQAAKLVKDKRVEVLATHSVPEGISSMLVFDETVSVEENTAAMTEAIGNVTSISTTYAVRDTQIDGVKINEGQILGLVDGKISCVADSDEECIEKLGEKMSNASFITIFYGENVKPEAAEEVLGIIKSQVADDTEITMLSGGQPLYDYIISAE